MEKETDTQLAKNSSSDNKVLCAASAYEKKYYFNPEFGKLPDYDISLFTHKKMKTNAETSLTVLKELLPILEAQEDFSNDALFAAVKTYIQEKGYKNGYVLWPVRIAVSGKQTTPAGATEIMEVLGKEESIARIREAIRRLEV